MLPSDQACQALGVNRTGKRLWGKGLRHLRTPSWPMTREFSGHQKTNPCMPLPDWQCPRGSPCGPTEVLPVSLHPIPSDRILPSKGKASLHVSSPDRCFLPRMKLVTTLQNNWMHNRQFWMLLLHKRNKSLSNLIIKIKATALFICHVSQTSPNSSAPASVHLPLCLVTALLLWIRKPTSHHSVITVW